MKAPSWKEIPIGGNIIEAGNSESYNTGTWRSYRPIHNPETCTNCLICWILCPDSSIIVKDGKMVGIDMLHCKGCGICANECPVNKNAKRIDAITMKLESDFK